MINKEYRKAALKTYGEACELCGHRTSLEVHHIDYQEHQEIENEVRTAEKYKYNLEPYLKRAATMGYDEYNRGQLTKNDDTKNLSVLCSRCHSFLHLIDYGKSLLKAIKPRR